MQKQRLISKNHLMMKSDNVAKEEKALHLLNEYRSGNDKAFETLYHLYDAQLLDYGTCLAEDRELVRDCIQDVFLQLVIRSRRQLINKVGGYLFVSLRNRILDAFRKKAVAEALTAGGYGSMEYVESTETQFISTEDAMQAHKNVISLFSELTPHQQEAFHLYFLEQRKYDEICKILKMDNPCIRNLIYRGMTRLRTSDTYQRIRAITE